MRARSLGIFWNTFTEPFILCFEVIFKPKQAFSRTSDHTGHHTSIAFLIWSTLTLDAAMSLTVEEVPVLAQPFLVEIQVLIQVGLSILLFTLLVNIFFFRKQESIRSNIVALLAVNFSGIMVLYALENIATYGFHNLYEKCVMFTEFQMAFGEYGDLAYLGVVILFFTLWPLVFLFVSLRMMFFVVKGISEYAEKPWFFGPAFLALVIAASAIGTEGTRWLLDQVNYGAGTAIFWGNMEDVRFLETDFTFSHCTITDRTLP